MPKVRRHGRGFRDWVFPRSIRQSLRLACQSRTLGIRIGAPLGFSATANMQWPKASKYVGRAAQGRWRR
eukprot:4862454-Alexandrium_andersonii.AAC.1